MASDQLLLLSVSLLLLIATASSALPLESIPSASESLTNSGHQSMALTLEFGYRSIIPPSHTSLTIFAPSDTAFTRSGQPSLSLLRFHFSPLFLSLHSLRSLPSGSKIPTLLPNRILTVTSSGPNVSLNGVRVVASTLFNDGSLVIFGTENFFDPEFEVSHANTASDCGPMVGGGNHSFNEASEVLRSRGRAITAFFLNLQLASFGEGIIFTILAPPDAAMKSIFRNNFNESVFYRHLLPCKPDLSNMTSSMDSVRLPSYLEGFTVNITKSDRGFAVNGIEVTDLKMYENSWLVVHGIQDSLFVDQGEYNNGGMGSSGKISVSFRVVSVLVAIFALCFAL